MTLRKFLCWRRFFKGAEWRAQAVAVALAICLAASSGVPMGALAGTLRDPDGRVRHTGAPLPSNAICAFPPEVAEVIDIATVLRPSRRVYLVQDAHNHVAVQRNISEVVSLLAVHAAQKGRRALVAVEGATGPIDTGGMEAYPDAKRREAVAAGLLRSGFLLGEEHAALTGPSVAFRIIGIEDPAHYRANVLAEADSRAARRRVGSAVAETQLLLSAVARHSFPAAFQGLEAARVRFETGTDGWADYLSAFEAAVPGVVDAFPALQRKRHLLVREAALDFQAIDKEADELIGMLMVSASDAAVTGLFKMGRAVEQGRLHVRGYYEHLLTFAPGPMPAIQSYVAFLTDRERFSEAALFAELPQAEAACAARLLRHRFARDLHGHIRWLGQLGRLVDLSLMREEWEPFRNAEVSAVVQRYRQVAHFVSEEVRDLGYAHSAPLVPDGLWAAALEGSFAFYRLAAARDEAMLARLDQALREYRHPGDVTAVIAGGFHTEGLLRGLMRRQMDVVVVRPRIDSADVFDGELDFPGLRAELNRRVIADARRSALRPVGALVANSAVVEWALKGASPAVLMAYVGNNRHPSVSGWWRAVVNPMVFGFSKSAEGASSSGVVGALFARLFQGWMGGESTPFRARSSDSVFQRMGRQVVRGMVARERLAEAFLERAAAILAASRDVPDASLVIVDVDAYRAQYENKASETGFDTLFASSFGLDRALRRVAGTSPRDARVVLWSRELTKAAMWSGLGDAGDLGSRHLGYRLEVRGVDAGLSTSDALLDAFRQSGELPERVFFVTNKQEDISGSEIYLAGDLAELALGRFVCTHHRTPQRMGLRLLSKLKETFHTGRVLSENMLSYIFSAMQA